MEAAREGRRVLGKVCREGGRKRGRRRWEAAQIDRETDRSGRKDSERVMKQEAGRRGEKEINVRRENTHPEFSLNQKLGFWWSIWK